MAEAAKLMNETNETLFYAGSLLHFVQVHFHKNFNLVLEKKSQSANKVYLINELNAELLCWGGTFQSKWLFSLLSLVSKN